MDMLRTLVSAQLLVTVFLAVLLWSLHTRLHRQEFNRWWVGAWTLSALFLGIGRLALAFPAGWSLGKGSVVLLATLLGFLVAPALVFGAVSFRSPGTVTRRTAITWLAAAALLGVLAFAASLLWSTQPLTSFAVRNGTRTAVLAAALYFCAVVFLQRVRATRSSAALLTSICCGGYAITQTMYAGAQLAHVIHSAIGEPQGPARLAVLASVRLLYVDVALICGICLGMILLLVEAHQQSERALLESIERGRDVADRNTALQTEISRRLEIERKLRASEDQYRDLVEHSQDLVCTHNLEGRFLSCNPSPARALGYTSAELLTMTVRDVLAPDARDKFDAYVDELKRYGVAKGLMRVVTRAGEERVWSYHNTLRTEGVAKPIARGMARDVTEQYQAQRARKDAEARQRAVLRALPDWTFLMDSAGVYLEFHGGDERNLLVPPSQFIGRNFREILPESLATRVADSLQAVLQSDEPVSLEYSLWLGAEHRFYEVRSVRAEKDHVLSIVRDVTDWKRAEHRVRDLQGELTHAGRVLALGTLSGSLAHEVNQPLAAIATNAHLALRLLDAQTPRVADLRDLLRDIVSDNRRIDDVLRRLRLLLRKDHRDYAPVDVNAIVSDVLKLVHSNLIERRISLEVVFGSQLPNVLGDRVQLQQVVLNILMNAADAVSAESADDRNITITTTSDDGQAIVSITDRGAPIPDVEFARMFEPFFTTKSDGMGIGLSICRTIMDAHGGEISVKRNVDRGLTCSFSLHGAETFSDLVAQNGGAETVAELHSA